MNLFKDSRPLYGSDPHVTNYKGNLILCESQDDERIILSHYVDGSRRGTEVVWEHPDEHQVWAPELHQINGLWFIYYAASNGDNKNHRMKVIGAATDPFGPYNFSERIGPDRWTIDMTTFTWKDQRYAVWSGQVNPESDFPQNLFIASMTSPVEINSYWWLLAQPDFDWEMSIEPILEGPQIFKENGKLYLLYSANASWKPEYSTGILELSGTNPLNMWHWTKCPWPLKRNAGHGMIVDDMFVYHQKMSTMPGWTDRKIVTISKGKLLEDGRFKDFKGEM